MTYEELKEALIEKGVDSKLFNMPAVRERLEKVNFGRISLDDIVINPDGTFNFENCIMQRGIIEREEEVPIDYERVVDPINGEMEKCTTYKRQKVSKEVLTIVEYFEKEYKKNQALDAPFNLRDDYESTFKELIAQLTIVDDDGIEIETQEIDNGLIVRDKLQQGTLNYKFFEEHPEIVSRKYTRSKGIIIEEKEENNHRWEFYDSGSWKIEAVASIGTREGDSPTSAMKEFEYNSQKLAQKYPHLQDSIRKREKELMEKIDSRTLGLISENINLKVQNDRLQKMLQKALTFVQMVRDSRMGKLLFGKKAKEVLGEQDKNVKQLPEER